LSTYCGGALLRVTTDIEAAFASNWPAVVLLGAADPTWDILYRLLMSARCPHPQLPTNCYAALSVAMRHKETHTPQQWWPNSMLGGAFNPVVDFTA
jgi:hypothetical protein